MFVVYVSYNSCILECISTKYLAVNKDQLILRLLIVVPGRCQLTRLFIIIIIIIIIIISFFLAFNPWDLYYQGY